MRQTSLVLTPALLWAAAVTAQEPPRERSRDPRGAFSFVIGADADRPRLGVGTSAGSAQDTAGLLVSSVTAGGPADKVGIKEGDRIVSIDGVSLRLSSADVDDPETMGLGSRRLIRELGRRKVGDDVELRVLRDNQTRTVKVKTASAESLQPERVVARSSGMDMDRATLGISVGSSASRRDTLGVLIVGVTDDGPAHKAGLEEGDRIAAINGVGLKVDPADAGDMDASSVRARRLTRELAKVKAGDDVELRVIRSGQTRTVRVKSVAARTLGGQHRQFMIGDAPFGGAFSFDVEDGGRALRVLPRMPRLEGPGVIRFDGKDDGSVELRLSPEGRADLERLRSQLGTLRERIRIAPQVRLHNGIIQLDEPRR